MLIDLSPLYKYRDYRLLFAGQFISYFGNMLTYVALPFQIYHLTHSSLAVGYIGIAQLIPLLITSLWGGALADKIDRRRLLLWAETGLLLTTFLLLLNTLLEPHVWVMYVLAGLGSGLNGFHRPAMEAMTQSLIKREDMSAVAALNSFKFSVTMIVGPSLAGYILAKHGLAVVYFIDALTYLISLIAIFSIQTRFVIEKAAEPIFSSILQGFRYAWSRQELMGTYAVDFVAMIFGMPMALFPAIAESFHSVSAIGWLYAGPSIGMLGASVFSSWANKIARQGIAISISASIWGAAIIAFGFSNNIYLAVFFLAIAGAADAVSGIFRITMWNQTIPHHLRGRLAGIEMISYTSGPLLGNAEAGLVAAAAGTTFSVVSGGMLCIVSVVILLAALPKFRKYKAVEPVSSS